MKDISHDKFVKEVSNETLHNALLNIYKATIHGKKRYENRVNYNIDVINKVDTFSENIKGVLREYDISINVL